MPEVRFYPDDEEAVGLRVVGWGIRCGTSLHRPAEVLRHVRHGPTALALSLLVQKATEETKEH